MHETAYGSLILAAALGFFLSGSTMVIASDNYEGLIDEVTDVIQAEAGTPIPRILELNQVLEKSGRAAQICASLVSDARFDGLVRMRVVFDTPNGEPVKTVRFRFAVKNRGEDGTSGFKCIQPNGVVVPEMTVANYRFKIRGRLIRRATSAGSEEGTIRSQFIGLQGIFERPKLQITE